MGEKESKSFAIIQSWKALDKSIIHIILLDFIYYSILLFVGSFYVYKVLPQALQLLDAASLLRDEIFASTNDFVTQAGSMLDQWTEFKVYTIVIGLLLFANYVIFKHFIWLKIQKKHQEHKKLLTQLGQFALLNLTIIVGIVLFLVGSYYAFVLDTFNIMFFFVAPLLFIYTMNLAHPLFTMTEKYTETWRLFWEVGIKQCYKFIIPHLIMLAGTVAMMWVVTLLLILPSALYFVWYVLCFAAYFTWTKQYIWAVIKKAQEKQ
ncbi:hypothetical protein HZC31_01235 [Candidatus Woesearchaeota archaeon]|nr:hypothetical protein [Candidatus Woesearchaeota archaeon]